MKMEESIIFAPVRRSQDDHGFIEWVDMSDSYFDLELCKLKIEKTYISMPDWCRKNPVVRISEFRLIETRTVLGA